MSSKVSVDEIFLHYFEKYPHPDPIGALLLYPAGEGGLPSFRFPHCPTLEKSCGRPVLPGNYPVFVCYNTAFGVLLYVFCVSQSSIVLCCFVCLGTAFLANKLHRKYTIFSHLCRFSYTVRSKMPKYTASQKQTRPQLLAVAASNIDLQYITFTFTKIVKFSMKPLQYFLPDIKQVTALTSSRVAKRSQDFRCED